MQLLHDAQRLRMIGCRRCTIPPSDGGPMYRSATFFIVSFTGAGILVAGCAKRPAMTATATAPAPATVAETKPPVVRDPASVDPNQGRQPARAAQKSSSGGRTEQTGTARPAVREFVDVPDLKEIHFDFDKYEIRTGDAQILDGNAQW